MQSNPPLIDLLMREPLARLEILLLKRRIQHAQSPYLARRRCVVAIYVGFGFAVRGLVGEGTCSLSFITSLALELRVGVVRGEEGRGGKGTHLLLVVKALVVVLKDGGAFRLARVVLGVCVGRVACEDFLPEGEAAGWAWLFVLADVLGDYL